jgi:hypothetical protein
VKKLYILLSSVFMILLLSSGAALAQVPGDTLWTERYLDVGSLASLAHAGSGNFVHIGNTGSTVIIRLVNDDGDLLGNSSFDGTGAVDVSKIVEYTDGGYLITGETGETVPGTGEVWIVRVDSIGRVAWQREWNYGGDDKGKGIAVDESGNIMVSGYVSEADLTVQAFLWKLSPDGDTIFQETYGGISTDVGEDVILTADGGYLIVGRTNSQGMGDYDGWVVKTDSLGDVQWEQTYGTIEFDMLNGVVELDDGYMLGGRIGPYGDASGWLIRTDLSGNVQWENTYGPDVGWNVFNRIMLAEDGRIGFCGFYQATYSTWRVWIGEIEIDGTPAWDANHGFTGLLQSSTALDFREVSGGGYMVCGQGRGSGWLLRIHDDPPGFVFDNEDAEFIELSGSWNSISHEGAYGGTVNYTGPGTGDTRAAWRVDTVIDPDTYEVYVWKFEHEYMHLMADNVPFKVGYASGVSDWIYVDQSTAGDEWVYLGTWEFDNSHAQGVLITDNANGVVIADAVKLVRVSP